MLPVDFIALMLVLETVDFFIVKKQLEMHIIVLEGQYIADNFELVLPVGSETPTNPAASMQIENQLLVGDFSTQGAVRFRFSPKSVQTWNYKIHSNVPTLDGQTGDMASCLPSPDAAKNPSAQHPNWWTDNPASEFAEGDHIGAKTVSQWREDFLRDFAERMQRCQAPRKADTISHSTSI